ncbi:MAG: sugar phosphate isomerase/epimerase [Caldilineaceae bacterium]|nr:sugar phosphate isomerase/epimerase [Caldilineaceae bacterium]MCB0126738.1 sugar phosphate isomerase/epimerase [Caldilineaceae bacterium]
MSNASFTISAFGDEIADKLAEQLDVLRDLQIRYLELRGVWGKNVLQLSDDEARRVRELCDRYGIGVSAIGSPIGKSPIQQPIATEVANLERIIAIGKIVGTSKIRVFSFYPPEGETDLDQQVPVAVARLRTLAEAAGAAGATLLLENEKGIVGDTVDRCHALLQGINHPAIVFAWDPANFVQVGEAQVTTDGWPKLHNYIGYIHIKDALLDGSVRAAGEGDGQVALLLAHLRDSGYQGMLALEPHLAVAGHSSGFSGPEGMRRAVEALRALMAAEGCSEA